MAVLFQYSELLQVQAKAPEFPVEPFTLLQSSQQAFAELFQTYLLLQLQVEAFTLVPGELANPVQTILQVPVAAAHAYPELQLQLVAEAAVPGELATVEQVRTQVLDAAAQV